jgi:outer membrane receptor protein involved in Fe transport
LFRWALATACALAWTARGDDQDLIPAEEPTPRERDRLPLEDELPETQVIRREQLEALPARDLGEVVNRLAGFRTQQRVQGEAAVVSIEGLPPEYTTLLVDGRRYSGRIGEAADFSDVPLADVERIEIVRGPQALRYGPEAAGGVINVITRAGPEEGARVDSDLGFGSDGALQGAGAAGVRLGRTGLRLSANRSQIDGFDSSGEAVYPASGGEDSRDVRDVLDLTARTDLGRGLELRSNLGFLREDEALVPEEDEAGEGELPREFERWLGSSRLRWHKSDATSAEASVGLFRGATEARVGRPYGLDEDEWQGDFSVDHRSAWLPRPNTLRFASSVRYQTLDLDEGVEFTTSDVELDELPAVSESQSLVSLTLTEDLELTSYAVLSLGSRLDLNSEFPSRWVPQVALLIWPASPVRFRFSAARTHRAPSLQDLYQPPVAQLGGAYFLAGSPDLDQEDGTSYRAGVELEPARDVALSATLFWNHIDDMIRSGLAGSIQTGTSTITFTRDLEVCQLAPSLPQCAPVTVEVPVTAPLFRKQNLDRVETQGLELLARWRPVDRVEFSLGYTLLETEVDSPTLVGLDELPNSPRHTLDLQTHVRAPRSDTTLTLAARWRDEALVEGSGTGLVTFAEGETSDPSWVVDARLSQPLFGRYEAYLDVLNAFDQRTQDSYEIRGRTLFLGVRGSFPWQAR